MLRGYSAIHFNIDFLGLVTGSRYTFVLKKVVLPKNRQEVQNGFPNR